MKQTFALTHPRLKPARLVDSIKHDVKKYLKRERNKKLPKGTDYWSFDCRFGATEAESLEIFSSEINKHIDDAVAQGLDSFYLEILARATQHKAKSQPAFDDDEYDLDDEDDYYQD